MLEQLPTEILCDIVSYVDRDVKTLYTIGNISNTLREISSDERFWKRHITDLHIGGLLHSGHKDFKRTRHRFSKNLRSSRGVCGTCHRQAGVGTKLSKNFKKSFGKLRCTHHAWQELVSRREALRMLRADTWCLSKLLVGKWLDKQPVCLGTTRYLRSNIERMGKWLKTPAGREAFSCTL